jgi:hypothetical protein
MISQNILAADIYGFIADVAGFELMISRLKKAEPNDPAFVIA